MNYIEKFFSKTLSNTDVIFITFVFLSPIYFWGIILFLGGRFKKALFLLKYWPMMEFSIPKKYKGEKYSLEEKLQFDGIILISFCLTMLVWVNLVLFYNKFNLLAIFILIALFFVEKYLRIFFLKIIGLL